MVEGMGGKNTFYETKVYMVPIMVNNKKYEFPCYGMDEISSVASPPEKSSYDKICKKFGVKPNQMKRPESIDLLISMRQNFLHPEPVKTIDRLVLYDGPLGKVFGGQDKDLKFNPHVACVPKSVHLCTTWQGAQVASPPAQILVSEVTENRDLDEGTEKHFPSIFKKSQVSVTNLAEKKTVKTYNPKNKEPDLARWAGRASMVTKEEKDWNINTRENEDVIAESLPPPAVTTVISSSKEKSIKSTSWVCINMLFLSLLGLHLVHQHIQVIQEVSDMQEVMRKVVNTLDIRDNRIVQVVVEKLIDKLKVPELINQYQVGRINQSTYHQSTSRNRRFPAVVVKPNQSGNGPRIVTKPNALDRHVNKLIVLVPVDEHIVQPQPEVQGIQGDADQLEQVFGHDMLGRTEEKFAKSESIFKEYSISVPASTRCS